MKNTFPKEEGWFKATLTLEKGATLERATVINMLTAGRPDDYEIGEYRELKTRIICYFRKK